MSTILSNVREILTQFPFAYLFLINLAGLIMMAWDKLLSKGRKRRIPEKWLFLVALLGGSIGAWIGMQAFRHKTRHAKFVFGIPAIIALQTAVTALIIYHF